MKKIACLFILVFLVITTEAQQTLVQWNFDTPLPPDNILTTGSTIASMGGGDTHLIGGTNPSAANPFSSGSDNDFYTNGTDNSGWNITRFPAQGTANMTGGIQFMCSTTGFQNIILKYDEKHSNSAANTTVIQYNPDTLNAGGWINIQTNTITASGFSTDWMTHTVDFSSIPAVNNQPRFGIRVVAAFDPANGSNYISTLNQTAASYSATGGTIRFDMVTITGTPISGCSLPTVQAADPVIITTNSSQIQFSFNRGNGNNVLVVCRQDFAVNDFPQAGLSYTANAIFGSGSQIGAGNYVVYNSSQPGKNIVTVNGLTPAKVYYFFIFEYSNLFCYKLQPLYFHATTGGTLFKPGELLLLGFDTRVPGAGTGNDKIYITPLVDITPGTQFNLTSSRFEAGAAPNTRTNRWYNSGDFILKDMDVQEFTWTGGVTIPAGSIIGIEDKTGSVDKYDSVTVGGMYQPGFVSDNKKGAFNIPTATTKGEQVYISQGSYYPVGDFFVDRYNLLFGHVLFGMSLYADWVPFSSSPGTASAGIAFRNSRIPPDIKCMHISNLSDTVGVGVYNSTLTGSPRFFKSSMSSNGNWIWKIGDASLNITQNFSSPYGSEVGQPLTIVPSSNTDGTWVGEVNNDWFDCGNWEGFYVPDSSTNVIIKTPVSFQPVITTSAMVSPAMEYANIAQVKNLNITETGLLSLAGNINDSLKIYKNLSILSGSLDMSAGSSSSKLILNGNWNHTGGTFLSGTNSLVSFVSDSIQQLSNPGIETFQRLWNKNAGLQLAASDVIVNKELGLLSGNIFTSIINPLTLTDVANILSPVNNYGVPNEGYEGSFVDGLMKLDISSLTTKIIPIGKGSVYAPVKVQKITTDPVTYTAEYFPVAYSVLTVDIPNVHHVSTVEHWIINTSIPAPDPAKWARVTLSWRPASLVSNITNWQDSILVAHYYTDNVLGTKWFSERDYSQPNIVSGNTNYGTITSNRIVSVYSPFTLGTKSPFIMLPLNLISWHATNSYQNVLLHWLVSSEEDVRLYTVERSANGRSFIPVATVPSLQRSGNENYDAIDQNPLSQMSYYRLKISDRYGQISYSNIIKVNRPENSQVSIFPNPASDEINVHTGSSGIPLLVEITDNTGKVLTKRMLESANEKIIISHLAAGIYNLRLTGNNQVVVKRFIKM